MPPTIAILAQGHAGDRLGSRLIPALQARFPGATLIGVGGAAMERAGAQIAARSDTISAIGWMGLLPLVPVVYQVMQRAGRQFRAHPPDAVVAVDCWQPLKFFHRFSPELKAAPHVCYLPPGPNLIGPTRVHTRASAAFQALITPFPHQLKLYSEAGGRVRSAAHAGLQTMLEEVQPRSPAEREPLLALLPGSRAAEIRYGLSVQWEAAKRLLARHPELRPVVCCASDEVEREVRARFPDAEVHRNAREIMARARFGIICSGTATLEAAVLGCPGVVTYHGSPLQLWEWKTFHVKKLQALRSAGIASPYVALPNILSGRLLYPEYVDGTVEAITAGALQALARDPEAVQQDLMGVSRSLGWEDAGEVVAEEVARVLEGRRGPA